MLAQLVVAPWATLHQVGPALGALICLTAGGLAAAILGPGVSRPGTIGPPEYATAAIAGTMVLVFLAAFLYTSVCDNWESRFWGLPWSDAVPADPKAAPRSGRRSSIFRGQACPFTGLQPGLRCPSCKAAVHERAFNAIEKKTTFVVGETVLRWNLATEALEKRAAPASARIELDEALDFTATAASAALRGSAASIACRVALGLRTKPKELACRWSLTCGLMAAAFIAGPWSFQSSMASVNNGKNLQWWMLLQALLFASYAWAVEAKRLALALAFMARFETVIPFPNIVKVPQGGWKRAAVRIAAGREAWRHVNDP